MPLPTLRSAAFTALSFVVQGLSCVAASAQVPEIPTDPVPGVSVTLRVRALYREGRHAESLRLLQPYLGDDPADYTAWVLASQTALTLGYGAIDADPDTARVWLDRALEYGRGAERLDPSGVDGRYMVLGATGQMALISGQLEQARLAKEIERQANEILAIDSLHAGAHDALGRLYFMVADLSGIKRFFARPFLGGDLMGRATWTAAERHLRLAVALMPERNFYRLDLARLLLARGQDDEARRELEQTLAVPLEAPEQEGFRKEARALLAKLDEDGEASGGGA